jgi:hypothetical protein
MLAGEQASLVKPRTIAPSIGVCQLASPPHPELNMPTRIRNDQQAAAALDITAKRAP